MLPYRYTYLFGSLVFFIPWLILFIHRPDLRKQIISMSLITAIVGILAEYFLWTKDWWHPQTITDTIIGPEDFLLGLSNGGIAAVLYEELFRKRLYTRVRHPQRIYLIYILLFVSLISMFLYFGLKTSSFVITTAGILLTALILLILRRDLLISSCINGFLMVLIVIPVFLVCELVSPGVIRQMWLFSHLTGIVISGAPLEDLVFYFLVGMVSGPLYEYWYGYGLRKEPAAKIKRRIKD